jgi:hypothetical protein
VPNPDHCNGQHGCYRRAFPDPFFRIESVGRNAQRWEDFPHRQFLHLAAGAAGLAAVSEIATAQTYLRIV